MANPILRYLGGRPLPGTGVASDYFRQPPDLSYLQEQTGYPLPDDAGYAIEQPMTRLWDTNQIDQAARSGVIPNSMRAQLYSEQNQPRGVDDARRRYDAAWAMHYLNQADPSDPKFSEGLARMFQQFPGAAQDRALMSQVSAIRSAVPAARLSSDAMDLYKKISAIPLDDPDYAEKHSKIVNEADPSVFNDHRIASFIDRTANHAMTISDRRKAQEERQQSENNKALSFFKKIPEAFQYYNDAIAKGGKDLDVINKMKELAGYAPVSQDPEDHRDFWRMAKEGKSPEDIGKFYSNKGLIEQQGVDPARFGLLTEDGGFDDEKLTDFRKHLATYGESPAAAMAKIAKDPNRARQVKEIDKSLEDASSLMGLDDYALYAKTNKQFNAATVEDIKAEVPEDVVKRNAQTARASLIEKTKRAAGRLRSAGLKQNEIYNYIDSFGINPDEIGVQRKRFKHEAPDEEPQREEKPAKPSGPTPNALQIQALQKGKVSPQTFNKLFGEGAADNFMK